MKIIFQLDTANDACEVVVDRQSVPAMGDTLVTGDERYVVTRVVHMLDDADQLTIVAATSR